MNLQSLLVYFPIFVLALCVHEYAHAWTAVRRGDPTPRWQGRLTLNPRVHMSLLGSILFVLTGFGWANPVHVNTRNLKNPKTDMVWVALAGPLSNLALAVVFAALYQFMTPHLPFTRAGMMVEHVLYAGAQVNVMLFVFNLLPIPPLDGSKILARLAPSRWNYALLMLDQYGVLILFFLLTFLNFGRVIGVATMGVLSVLGV